MERLIEIPAMLGTGFHGVKATTCPTPALRAFPSWGFPRLRVGAEGWTSFNVIVATAGFLLWEDWRSRLMPKSEIDPDAMKPIAARSRRVSGPRASVIYFLRNVGTIRVK